MDRRNLKDMLVVCWLELGSKCLEDKLWVLESLEDTCTRNHRVQGRSLPKHRNTQLGKPNSLTCFLLQSYFYMNLLGKELEE